MHRAPLGNVDGGVVVVGGAVTGAPDVVVAGAVVAGVVVAGIDVVVGGVVLPAVVVAGLVVEDEGGSGVVVAGVVVAGAVVAGVVVAGVVVAGVVVVDGTGVVATVVGSVEARVVVAGVVVGGVVVGGVVVGGVVVGGVVVGGVVVGGAAEVDTSKEVTGAVGDCAVDGGAVSVVGGVGVLADPAVVVGPSSGGGFGGCFERSFGLLSDPSLARTGGFSAPVFSAGEAPAGPAAPTASPPPLGDADTVAVPGGALAVVGTSANSAAGTAWSGASPTTLSPSPGTVTDAAVGVASGSETGGSLRSATGAGATARRRMATCPRATPDRRRRRVDARWAPTRVEPVFAMTAEVVAAIPTRVAAIVAAMATRVDLCLLDFMLVVLLCHTCALKHEEACPLRALGFTRRMW